MVTGIVQFFYPDIKKDDIKKVGLLGIAFLFTVGSYWLLRLLKDIVLLKLAFPVSLGWSADQGRLMLPVAKMISPWVVLCAVMIYTKLVDMFEKHKLFYIIVSFYTIMFSLIAAVIFAQSTYGDAFVGKEILRLTGFASYLLTESFGSVLIALFWSFTVSSTTSDQAKRTFPFIVALGQLGSISCSALLLFPIKTWVLFTIAIGCLVGVFLSIRHLVAVMPADQMKSDKEEKKSKPDMLGGIKLLLTEPYLLGVLVVSTFYEIAGTIVDYQMKSQVLLAGMDFEWFQGVYGTSVNCLSFIMALLGTSRLMKKFGIRTCLLVYPASFAFMLISLFIYYQSGASTPFLLAWAVFAVMLVVKAASYAVNNPIKEMMYIPTSKDAKFKAKGIIDMLGGRSAKATGAKINSALQVPGNTIASMHNLFFFGSIISLGVIGIWVIAALFVGNKNQKLVKNGEIIG